MKEARVKEIIAEESMLGTEGDFGERLRIRLGQEVADGILSGKISKERFDLVMNVVRREAVIAKIYQHQGAGEVGVVVEDFFGAYESVVNSLQFLLENFASTSDRFKKGWDEDALVEVIGVFAVEKDQLLESMRGDGRFEFRADRAGQLLNLMRWAWIGIAGEELYRAFMAEMNSALGIVRDHFRSYEEN